MGAWRRDPLGRTAGRCLGTEDHHPTHRIRRTEEGRGVGSKEGGAGAMCHGRIGGGGDGAAL